MAETTNTTSSSTSLINVKPLRYWTYKLLPLVYDDSLSYLEILSKAVYKLNQLIKNNNQLPELIKEAIADGGYLDNLQEQIAELNDKNSATATADRYTGQLIWLNGDLYRITRNMLAGDQYTESSTGATGNIEKITFEEFVNRFRQYVKNGITATDEGYNTIATSEHTVGSWLWWHGELYRVTTTIPNNGDIDTRKLEKITIEEINKEIQTLINTEISDRQAADTELQNNINTEISDRTSLIRKDSEGNTEIPTAEGIELEAGKNYSTTIGGDSITEVTGNTENTYNGTYTEYIHGNNIEHSFNDSTERVDGDKIVTKTGNSTFTQNVQPTIMYFTDAFIKENDSDEDNPVSTVNPVKIIQAVRNHEASSITLHTVDGEYIDSRVVGGRATHIGLLSQNRRYGGEGGNIGLGGFASSDIAGGDGSMITGLWAYTKTPNLEEAESYNAATAGIEVNMDINTPDPGRQENWGVGFYNSTGVLLNNYRDTGKPVGNWTFGLVIEGTPSNGDYAEQDITKWNAIHTGILIDRILNEAIRIGHMVAPNATLIYIPTSWVVTDGTVANVTAMSMGNSKLNLGTFTGNEFNTHDLWQNGDNIYFRTSDGVSRYLLLDGVNINVDSNGVQPIGTTNTKSLGNPDAYWLSAYVNYIVAQRSSKINDVNNTYNLGNTDQDVNLTEFILDALNAVPNLISQSTGTTVTVHNQDVDSAEYVINTGYDITLNTSDNIISAFLTTEGLDNFRIVGLQGNVLRLVCNVAYTGKLHIKYTTIPY